MTIEPLLGEVAGGAMMMGCYGSEERDGFVSPFTKQDILLGIKACRAVYDDLRYTPDGWHVVRSFAAEMPLGSGMEEIAVIFRKDGTDDYRLGIRGTATVTDMYKQLDYSRTFFTPYSVQHRVDMGVVKGSYDIYLSFRSELIESLKAIESTTGISRLDISGHSLGTALGRYTMLDIVSTPAFQESDSDHGIKFPVSLLEVAAIMSTDTHCREYYLNSISGTNGYINNLSINNVKDVITDLPPVNWAARWPVEYNIDFGEPGDILGNHSIRNYEDAVERLFPDDHAWHESPGYNSQDWCV